MPWTNMDISINGEKINAMAKVIWEKGTGTIELPFDESKKLDDKITIDGKDFTVRNIVSRHNEITLLDIIQVQEKSKKKILNCPKDEKIEVLAEINRRFGMPLYVPFVALLCSFLLINREESKFNNFFKWYYICLYIFYYLKCWIKRMCSWRISIK